jgi:iron complex transport system substrate-binding protein
MPTHGASSVSGTPRRRLLGIAVALLAFALAGFGGSSSSSTGKTGAWRFTDDRGVTVSLKTRPKRIVAYDVAARALMDIGVKPVGILASFPAAKDVMLQGLDLSGVKVIAAWQINLEALAALRPDLIVTVYEPPFNAAALGFADKATQAKAQHIAPIVAIDSLRNVTTVIDRFEKLGKALGIDLKSPGVIAAHKHFAAASARLRAATAAKPRLKAVALGGVKGVGYSIARPGLNPTLRLFEKLGLHLVKPTSKPANINTDYVLHYFEHISFELADKYPADLILLARSPALMSRKELDAIPTWQQLPAVKAGQVVSWRLLDPFSYKLLSADLDALAKAVKHARVVI